MRILIVNQYFPPDSASTGKMAGDLAAALLAAGHDVSVIAGQPSYDEDAGAAPARETRGGVTVYRVPVGPWRGRARLAARFAGYVGFVAAAAPRFAKVLRRERPDVVVTFHNPPAVGLFGVAATRLGARFVYIPHDLHPEAAVAGGWRLPPGGAAAWGAMERQILAAAARVIVLGEAMATTLVERKGVPAARVSVIPPWPIVELEPAPRDLEMRAALGVGPDDLMFLAAGNMGRLHPLDLFLEAAAGVDDAPVHWFFSGGGAQRDHWERRARRMGLERVHFAGHAPRGVLARRVAAADACLVSLGEGAEALAYPSRVVTLLSAGRPLVTSMLKGSEIAAMIEDAGAGWNVTTPLELVGLCHAWLRDRAGLDAARVRARRLFERRFGREEILARYVAAVEGAGGAP